MQTAETIDWASLLLEPIKHNGEILVGYLPGLINAFYTLALGFFGGFITMLILRRFFKFIGFDKIAEKSGIAASLVENNVTTKPAEWICRLFFWMIMIAAMIRAFSELQLGDLAQGLDLFSGFVFQSLGLLVIFMIGIFLSTVLSKIIHTTSASLKVKSPQVYSGVMKGTILVFTILLILRQIAIPVNLVFIIVGGIFVTLCITFVLAFGLGGTGWAGKTLERLSK